MKRKNLAPVVLAGSLLAMGGWVAAQQQQPATPPAGSSQSAQGTTGSSAGTPPATSTTRPAPGTADTMKPGAATRSTAATPGGMSAGDRAMWDRRHRASKIIGTDVRNPAGEKIGDIEDLVIDDKGMTQVAIVSTGGFLGIGDSLHAVPWSELKMATDEKSRGDRILNIDKAQLKEIPGFSSNEWPNFADPAWADKNRGFFNR